MAGSSEPWRRPRKRKSFHRTLGPCFGASLSFQEIADQLGVSNQAVQQSYRSGMAKLRARPATLARLAALATELATARQARLRGQVTVPAVPLPW